MSIGKHSLVKEEHKKNKYFHLLKILFLFLITFIIIDIVYYFSNKNLTNPNISNENTIDTEKVYEISETVSTEETLIVKGAEYLEIRGVYINSDNPKLSSVSIKIKNNSNEVHENIELNVNLLDKDNTTITTLDCKINKLEPNEETVTYGSLMQDLSTCVNYSIGIIKK